MPEHPTTETSAEVGAAQTMPMGGEVVVQNATQAPSAVAMTGQVLPPKKKRRRVVLPLVLLAAVAGGGYEGYKWFVEGRFLVSTDDAYVKADMSIIAAKVGGYVTTVPIVDNVHVTKGQVLATIDDGDYKIAVDSAQTRIDTQDATIARIGQQVSAQNAMIDQAKAQLLSAKAEAQRTVTEYQRANSLMQSSYGTQQRLDQALTDRDRSAAAVASAVAALSSAEANVGVLQAQKLEAQKVRAELGTTLARAQRDLDFTIIKAPFDGIIGNKAVQPGQYVQTGTRLLALVPLDSAYVEANFKETQLDRLKPGQKVTIKPDAFSSRTIEGEVESVAPASGAEFSMLPPENATGNFTKIVQRIPVRIKIPTAVADERLLRPGLSVEVEVHTRDENEPQPSLMTALGLDAVASAVRQHTSKAD
ncbi:HlyD family secretion protein [Lichenihabitans sp. PAMC28606]|uniref:HlyD family secretion protein n=1 Tax=Lichenihabitans sp. PAMC28606 TaxID=2880932 RepID=UPI001D0B7A71|nr:HlyD family secretion protein [Lichenihabitans sp. PAMC28606]UDL96480.1 HlyD family secretion protein [Lichenihabitans sp. PAMC28606]